MWSASSEVIIAGRSVIHLGSGETCELPLDLGHGFVSPHRIVSQAIPAQQMNISNDPTELDFFDDNCRHLDKWEPEPGFFVDDVSFERGMLVGYVRRASISVRPTNYLVLDAGARKIVAKWPWPEAGGEARFANFGRAICLATTPDGPKRVPLRCLDVGSGRVISEAAKINGGAPIFTADHASLIIADDTRGVRLPFGERGTIFERRVVWDFQTGKELLSWRPDTQLYLDTRIRPPLVVKTPFNVAISPDGNYIAEGGNGTLRLYRIE
jgi:hypothetical protein